MLKDLKSSLSLSNTIELYREWAKADLFFLLVFILGRKDAFNDWVFDRCRQVQSEPNECLDLWAREHYKSTIITYALTIFDIINNPELTFGIFSHTRDKARTFLKQIKAEFETNSLLARMYPNILYSRPKNQSQVWTDDAFCVMRQNNKKEQTVEAWGVVDNQPIGRHFDILIYDDVVVPESVNTEEQILKTTERLRLSFNLGTANGVKRFIGTRYHLADTYDVLMRENIVKPRVYAATDNGKIDGEPVFLSRQQLQSKYQQMGSRIFACQMLQNPKADATMGFNADLIKYYKNIDTKTMNLYLLVDPASKKRKKNDFTVMLVIGLGEDGNYYLVWGLRDKLSLSQRKDKAFELMRMFNNPVVGYEEYGIQADIEALEEEMEARNYRFKITALGGNIPKNDRILKLQPTIENGKFYLPSSFKFVDFTGLQQDLTQQFLDELKMFPFCLHDDILDCASRIVHKQDNWQPVFPKFRKEGVKIVTAENYQV